MADVSSGGNACFVFTISFVTGENCYYSVTTYKYKLLASVTYD